MSLTPQWKVPPGLELRWGLDNTVQPNAFIVGERATKSIYLDFAQGKIVRSLNPHIADVSEGSPDGQSRVIDIEGKLPSRTRIEVRDPGTNALRSTLIVRVKSQQSNGISLNFVEDGLFNKTVLQPGIANGLVNDLNSIYSDQTNIQFEMIRSAKLELNRIYGDIVREEADIEDPKVKTGFTKIGMKQEWKKVFGTYSNDGFNIYFVPSDDPAKNDSLIHTIDNNAIIEDGKQPPIYTVSHAIGRMLGCPVTSDPNHMNQLMFWNQGVGSKFFPRSDDFITFAQAEIMNS